MFINKYFLLFTLYFCLFLIGCTNQKQWNTEYANVPATTPVHLNSGLASVIYEMPDNTSAAAPLTRKNVSILLPMSGNDAKIGRGIANAVELAFARKRYDNISVSVYDMSGDRMRKQTAVLDALATKPDIIIGPVFANDVHILGDMKNTDIPALTFTSDANAVGNGVMTMALMPSNGIEQIIKTAKNDGATRIAIFAPKSTSGEQMAGAANHIANVYNLSVAGLLYYTAGNSDSIKNAANRAAMYDKRTAAHTRAREILSDIVNNENITATEKSNMRNQLARLNRVETIAKAPFDAVLFLGEPIDAKAIISFLRYFDVPARDIAVYGTALWDGASLANDITLAGAKFAALPPMSENFKYVYESAYGVAPTRLDSFGFDAANLAITMLYSNKLPGEYLLSPGGYNGLDGLLRLRPDGTSQRLLQVLEFTATEQPRVVTSATPDFITPHYMDNIILPNNTAEIEPNDRINPVDYINIPDRFRSKYRNTTIQISNQPPVLKGVTAISNEIILPEDDREIITDPAFTPIQSGNVTRQVIDEVEIYE